MSDLLNSASLVMIPSGYKEDVVYSQIPTDGSGDLSFTRASNGTRINSAGLVEVCPWNLLQESETFDSATWTKTGGASITANNTTAPNGTLTADRINLAASIYSGAYQFINQPNGVYANSIYAKAGTFNYLFVLINGSSGYYVWFNLATGTIGSKGANMEGTIESVGDGWYRCTVSRILNNDTNNYHQFGFSNAEDYTPATTGTAYIWGAQTNIGSTAKPYFPTTDRLNVPRLTYQNEGGGCPSLLLEKQSTNILTYSEDFSNAAWTKSNATITANATTSPDGTQNADKLVENTSTGEHYIIRVSATSTIGVAYTLSWYMKAGERNAVSLYNYSMNNLTAIFNANTGVATYVSGGTSYSVSMESVGNGWYRCIATSNASDTNQDFALRLVQSGTTINYTGDGTSGIFIWGAQIEASSYPTSYIPTTSASATRVADACFKTGISSLIGQTSGAAFIEFNSSFLESYTQRIFTLSDGTTNNVIGFQLTGANQLVFYVENGGTNQVVISKSSPAITLGSNVKIAAAYANNDFVFYVNGTQIGTDTSGSVPATSQVRFSEANASAFYLGLIKQIAIFKTRLTNAELASLTTI
jgi:hypothetical protein